MRTGRGPGKDPGATARKTVAMETGRTVAMETGVARIETGMNLREGAKSKDDPGNTFINVQQFSLFILKINF